MQYLSTTLNFSKLLDDRLVGVLAHLTDSVVQPVSLSTAKLVKFPLSHVHLQVRESMMNTMGVFCIR